MGDVYVNGTLVGTHDITAGAPAVAIPTEVWLTLGGVAVIILVGGLIYIATRRRKR